MGQIIPIRGMSEAGVITDVDPASLPLTAFTRAKNVRFDEGAVLRSPVFRTVKASLGFNPRYVYGVNPITGYSTVVIATDTYGIQEYANGSLTDRSGSISATSANDLVWTGTTLANIVYINRSDKVPSYKAIGGTNFAALTNWDSNWRAESLRSYGDFLIGLNMTESSTNYGTRVRWSNIATANAIPDSWDASDTTKSAGFNDLVQMQSPILDGATLGTNFIVYSKSDVWLMEFVGGTFIFNFRKVFSDIGIINQNCAIEVDSRHYVFADNDIYVHDGNTRESIVDQRVKNYIFQGLDSSKTDVCFVARHPELEEIYFCYNSGDDMAEFTASNRCNRAAVYNYKNGTWSFLDLPNVASATIANVNSSATYQNSTASYAAIGGSYWSQQANFDTHCIFVGQDNSTDGITSDKMYGLDLNDTGSLSFALDSEATKSPLLERTGIDLDEMVKLSGYKVINKVYPQITTNNLSKTFSFNFGAANLITGTPNYETTVTYDISADHKIDSRAAGRYLSYKLSLPDNKDFSFIGFDMDVLVTGRR